MAGSVAYRSKASFIVYLSSIIIDSLLIWALALLPPFLLTLDLENPLEDESEPEFESDSLDEETLRESYPALEISNP